MKHLLCFLLLLVPATQAAELPARFTLPSVLSAVKTHNPELARARRALTLTQADIEINSAYPNPRFEIQKSVPGDTGFYEIKAVQPVPLTRETSAAKNAALAEYGAAQKELRALETATLGAARSAWYTLLLSRQRQSFEQANLTFAADILGKVGIRLQTGQATNADMARAKVEVSRSQYRLEEAKTAGSAAQAELNALLGRQPDELFEIAPEVTLSLAPQPEPLKPVQTYMELARANRLEPQAMALRVQSADFALTLENNRRIPVPELGFIQGDDQGAYSRLYLGFSLPLWYNNNGQINRAKAQKTALGGEAQALELAINRQVFFAWQELNLAQKRLAAARETVATLNDLRRASAQDYLSGKADLTAFYEINRVFLEENLNYLAALTGYYEKNALLNAAANITEDK